MLKKVTFILEISCIVVFLLFFTSGILSLLHLKFFQTAINITELAVYLTNLTAVLFTLKNTNKKVNLIIWIGITFVITYFIEVIGVFTGNIFGNYYYGEVFAFKPLRVPIIIAFNWVVIILAANGFLTKLGNIYVKSFLSAFIIVILDIAIEPVAIKLGYWNWENKRVPFQNYVAWFLIASFFSYLMQRFKIKPVSILLKAYLIILFIFFYSLMLLL